MKSRLSSGKRGGIHATGEARGTLMENEVDGEWLAQCRQLLNKRDDEGNYSEEYG